MGGQNLTWLRSLGQGNRVPICHPRKGTDWKIKRQQHPIEAITQQ